MSEQEDTQQIIDGTIKWVLRSHGFTGTGTGDQQAVAELVLKTLGPGEETKDLLEDIQAVWEIQGELLQRFGIDKARQIIEAGFTTILE